MPAHSGAASEPCRTIVCGSRKSRRFSASGGALDERSSECPDHAVESSRNRSPRDGARRERGGRCRLLEEDGVGRLSKTGRRQGCDETEATRDAAFTRTTITAWDLPCRVSESLPTYGSVARQ